LEGNNREQALLMRLELQLLMETLAYTERCFLQIKSFLNFLDIKQSKSMAHSFIA